MTWSMDRIGLLVIFCLVLSPEIADGVNLLNLFQEEVRNFVFTKSDYNLSRFESSNYRNNFFNRDPFMGIRVPKKLQNFASNISVKFTVKATSYRLWDDWSTHGLDQFNFLPSSKLFGDFFFIDIRSDNDFNRESATDMINLKITANVRLKSNHRSPVAEVSCNARFSILPLNDMASVFDLSSYETDIDEDLPVFSTVTYVNAVDFDKGGTSNLYYFTKDPKSGFLVHPYSGAIILGRSVNDIFNMQSNGLSKFDDKECGSSSGGRKIICCSVQVYDNSGIFPLPVTTVKMTVTDAVTRPNIQVHQMPYVNKHATGYFVYAIIEVTDSNRGEHGEISRVFLRNKSSRRDLFRLRRSSSSNHRYDLLVNTMLTTSLPNDYEVEVVADDLSGASANRTIIVRLETSRNFPKDTYETFISEIVRPGTPVLSLLKASQTKDMTFNLSGDTLGWFSVNSSGTIVTNAKLDYETTSVVELNVMTNLTISTTNMRNFISSVTINLIDYNDNSPIFLNQSSKMIDISEDTDINLPLFSIAAIDNDSGDNGRIDYVITQSNPPIATSIFRIDSQSGLVFAQRQLDYETMSHNFSLTIAASDLGSPFSRTTYETYTIGLININDSPPLFLEDRCSGSILRSTPISSVIYSFKVIDPDGDELTFLAKSHAGDHCFLMDKIGDNSANLLLNCSLAEHHNNRVVVVSASDGKFTTSTNIELNVVDEIEEDEEISCIPTAISDIPNAGDEFNIITDEVPSSNELIESSAFPVIKSRKTVLPISEKTPTGLIFYRVEATDTDAGYNGVLRFGIKSGNVGHKFNISATTGDLSLINSLDRETLGNYNLEIEVCDMAIFPRCSDIILRIVVDDYNDCFPSIKDELRNAEIAENSSPNQLIMQINAADCDKNRTMLYRLQNDYDGSFAINANGILSTLRPLDREEVAVYDLVVEISDSPRKAEVQLTSIVKVRVHVNDENDSPPVFTQEKYIVNIPEDFPNGTLVLTVFATDADTIASPIVTYDSIDHLNVPFQIVEWNGAILVTRPLDYERDKVYEFEISARDNGVPIRSGTATVQINIIDVNEVLKPPVFDKPFYSGSVPENTEFHLALTIKARPGEDAPSNTPVTYEIKGGNGLGSFEINNAGEITSKTPLDREYTSSYWLLVYATQHSTTPLSSFVEIYIEVTDTNDSPPYASPCIQRAFLTPEEAPSFSYKVINAERDVKKQTNKYEIIAGNEANLFVIDTPTGTIRFADQHGQSGKRSLQAQDEFQLLISIYDNTITPGLLSVSTEVVDRTAEALVIIKVVSTNSSKPTFLMKQPSIKFTAFVGYGGNQIIGQVIAYNEDLGQGKLKYNIARVSRTERAFPFRIDPKTGWILTKPKSSLNRVHAYNFQVVVKIQPGRKRRRKVQVVVDVISLPSPDITRPVFSQAAYETSINEDLRPGPRQKEIIRLTLANNHDPRSPVIYSILPLPGPEISKTFAVEQDTGKLFLIGPLDYESTKKYKIPVRVSNGRQSDDKNVTITVKDINDNSPQMVSRPSSDDVDVSSGKVRMTLVEDVSTSEPFVILRPFFTDADSRDDMRFTIAAADNLYTRKTFTIDENTGALFLTDKLDYSVLTEHRLVVKIENRQNNVVRYTLTEIVVVVKDIRDDYSPKLLERNIAVELAELEPIGTEVADVQEEGEHSQPIRSALARQVSPIGNVLQYAIHSGNRNDTFAVDENSGVVTLAKSLIDQRDSIYQLVISARNRDNPAINTTADITVKVVESDYSPPKFATKLITSFLMENRPAGTFVTTVKAQSRSLATYRVENPFFTIGLTTGSIFSTRRIDRERQSSLRFTVFVSNVLSKHNATTEVMVKILDENDNAPEWERRTFSGYVRENKAANTIVCAERSYQPLVLRATDLDIDRNGQLTYKIINSLAKEYFTIEPRSGIIRTLKSLDREKQAYWVFDVDVHDNGTPQMNARYYATVNVSISDANDNPPAFAKNQYNFTVIIPLGHQIGQVIANDSDSNSVLTFGLLGDSNLFKIDSQTGLLSFKRIPNLTSESESFKVKVSVSDGESATHRTFKVIIKDLTKSKLKFQKKKYLTEMVENTKEVMILKVIRLQNLGLTCQPFFHLHNYGNLFRVGLHSGVLRSAGVAFDRETQAEYHFRIIVECGGDMGQTSVVVKITDVNDNVPKFVGRPYHIAIPTDYPPQPLKTIEAIDRDTGINSELRYELIWRQSSDRHTAPSFFISPDNGTIYLVRPTAEHYFPANGNNFTLDVNVTDKGNPALSSTAPLTIQILAQLVPRFGRAFYKASIKENVPIGTKVIDVSASSPASANNKIVYSIIGGDVFDQFDVEFMLDMNTNSLCIVKTKDHLDREIKDSYKLVVQATDLKSGRTSSVPLYVTVKDVNDEPPVFTQSLYEFSISESLLVDTDVFAIRASDKDLGINNAISYSLENRAGDIKNTVGYFSINQITGSISLVRKLDCDNMQLLRMVVVAEDSGTPSLSSKADIKIKCKDSNDNSPYFLQDPNKEVAFSEILSQGDLVTVISARDKDKFGYSQLKYQLASGDEYGMFGIDERSGVISLYSADRQKLRDEYNLTISVTDGVHSTFTHKMINVRRENLHAPKFTKSRYPTSVPEDTGVDTPLVTVLARDADNDKLFGSVKYRFLTPFSSDNRQPFQIDSQTGVVSPGVGLDREYAERYLLTVMAYDDEGRSDFAEIDIEVTDVNDNSPRPLQDDYDHFVFSNARSGKVIFQVEATDADAGLNAALEYSLYFNGTNQFAQRHFKIDPKTGVISTKSSLDNLVGKVVQFWVQIVDSSPKSRSTLVDVTIRIISPTTVVPNLIASDGPFFVDEDIAIGGEVTSVKAQFSNNKSTIEKPLFVIEDSFENAANDPVRDVFKLEGDGRITVNKALDREVKDTYNLMASVRIPDSLNRVYHPITIKVRDINDNHPVFDSFVPRIKVTENIEVGQPILRLHAIDKDTAENADITYRISTSQSSLLAYPGGLPFKIDAKTGWLEVSSRIDYELVKKYRFNVTAKDKALPTHTEMEVEIVDFNDNPPVFADDFVSRYEVKEDVKPGFLVASLPATDADTGRNAEVSYYITKGDEYKQFEMTRDGQLLTVGPLDREMMTSKGQLTTRRSRAAKEIVGYNLEIAATDGVHVTKINIEIDIKDVNDNVPQCSLTSGHLQQNKVTTINENVRLVQPLLTIAVEDADYNDQIRYEIRGKGAEALHIQAASLYLADQASGLDREVQDFYRLEVLAFDSKNNSCGGFIEFSVKDENDNAPVFERPSYEETIKENLDSRTLITRVQATDKDLGINRQIEYFLKEPSNYSNYFTVDKVTGLVRTNRPLDREVRSQYHLEIIARDKGVPPLNSSVQMTVRIADANDNPPEFIRTDYNASVRENIPSGREIIRVEAISKDEPSSPNAKISYFIVGGNHPEDLFYIDNVTGAISVKSGRNLDYELVRSYSLMVEARDHGVPQLSSTTVVSIDLLDVNDNSPVFKLISITKHIREDSPPNTLVDTVLAVDDDGPEFNSVSYTIKSRDDREEEHELPFLINPISGKVTTSRPLDREQRPSYTLIVVASDGDRTAEMNMIVTVTDVNDNSPTLIFPRDMQIDVPEDHPLHVVITKFKAIDKDEAGTLNSKIDSYLISSGDSSNLFTLNNTGALYLNRKPSHLTKNRYSLVIEISDSSELRPQTTTFTYNINIIPPSSNPPTLTTQPIGITVHESQMGEIGQGRKIGSVFASDLDKTDKLTYLINSLTYVSLSSLAPRRIIDQDMFFMKKSSSNIYLTRRIRKGGDYMLNVSVTDGKFTVFKEQLVRVTYVTEEMERNAVPVRLALITPQDLENNWSKMQLILQRRLGPGFRITLLSIKPSGNKLRRRGRRSTHNDGGGSNYVDIAIVATDPSGKVVDRERLQEIITNAANELSKALLRGEVLPNAIEKDVCYNSEGDRSISQCPEGDKCSTTVDIVSSESRKYSIDNVNREFFDFVPKSQCICEEFDQDGECVSSVAPVCLPECKRDEECRHDPNSRRVSIFGGGRGGGGLQPEGICVCLKAPHDIKNIPCPVKLGPQSFRAQSFIKISLMDESRELLWDSKATLRIKLKISTTSTTASLLYFGMSHRHDILYTLSLVDGYLVLNNKLESREMKTSLKINDGSIHDIWLFRRLGRRNDLKLIVDKERKRKPETIIYLSHDSTLTPDYLVIGALDVDSSIQDPRDGFVGCVSNINIDGGAVFEKSPSILSVEGLIPSETSDTCPVLFAPSMPCNGHRCKNNGVCVVLDAGKARCDCAAGWTGDFCEVSQKGAVTPVRPDGLVAVTCPTTHTDCLLHGTCFQHQQFKNITCKCRPGWTGLLCTEDINECRISIKICNDPFGSCRNLPGSYNCTCDTGRSGRHCEILDLANITPDPAGFDWIGIVIIACSLLVILGLAFLFVLCRRHQRHLYKEKHKQAEPAAATSAAAILSQHHMAHGGGPGAPGTGGAANPRYSSTRYSNFEVATALANAQGLPSSNNRLPPYSSAGAVAVSSSSRPLSHVSNVQGAIYTPMEQNSPDLDQARNNYGSNDLDVNRPLLQQQQHHQHRHHPPLHYVQPQRHFIDLPSASTTSSTNKQIASVQPMSSYNRNAAAAPKSPTSPNVGASAGSVCGTPSSPGGGGASSSHDHSQTHTPSKESDPLLSKDFDQEDYAQYHRRFPGRGRKNRLAAAANASAPLTEEEPQVSDDDSIFRAKTNIAMMESAGGGGRGLYNTDTLGGYQASVSSLQLSDEDIPAYAWDISDLQPYDPISSLGRLSAQEIPDSPFNPSRLPHPAAGRHHPLLSPSRYPPKGAAAAGGDGRGHKKLLSESSQGSSPCLSQPASADTQPPLTPETPGSGSLRSQSSENLDSPDSQKFRPKAKTMYERQLGSDSNIPHIDADDSCLDVTESDYVGDSEFADDSQADGDNEESTWDMSQSADSDKFGLPLSPNLDNRNTSIPLQQLIARQAQLYNQALNDYAKNNQWGGASSGSGAGAAASAGVQPSPLSYFVPEEALHIVPPPSDDRADDMTAAAAASARSPAAESTGPGQDVTCDADAESSGAELSDQEVVRPHLRNKKRNLMDSTGGEDASVRLSLISTGGSMSDVSSVSESISMSNICKIEDSEYDSDDAGGGGGTGYDSERFNTMASNISTFSTHVHSAV